MLSNLYKPVVILVNILVTGGAGFIGANFLNLLVPQHREHHFVNFDKLTYAANPYNLQEVESLSNYTFVQGDIADYQSVAEVFAEFKPRVVVHFAAESHVDRSILGPAEFVDVNITGTFYLLEACRKHWTDTRQEQPLFLQVSTDEVYGSLPDTGYFTENSPYDPSSPYSASKAAADHFIRAYYRTYGLPVIITNCSNNFGPLQFPEKLMPLMILNAISGQKLPVYGKGENIRDWLYVEDNCRALWEVLWRGRVGETYNIGANNEKRNIDVVREICHTLAEETGAPPDTYLGLINFVSDRPGHDRRYALDATKIRTELGWTPRETFQSGLQKTVRWYLHNREWVEKVHTGDYRQWIEANYGHRRRMQE